MAEDAKWVSGLRDKLIVWLAEIPGAVINGDLENRLPGNVNVSFAGIEGESLVLLLDERGICASSGSACSSSSLASSHVLLAIGQSSKLASGDLRLSLLAENTDSDVVPALRVIPELVRELRGRTSLQSPLTSRRAK